MQLHIFDNANDLSNAAAKWIADTISETLKSKDRFTIALSGGSTPQKLHTILAASPYKEQVDWSRVHFFWGDERAVPFEDNRNNAKMAFDTLLDHVPVQKENIHVMRTDISPEESADEYENKLKEYFSSTDNAKDSFDLVLLGMGDDGHTLSLFPGLPVVHESQRWATAFFLQQQDMFRITLTAPIVNRSAKIAFLVAGAGKAPALKEVLKGKYDPDKYPSQQIKPIHGELVWFVDKAAAAEL